MFRIDGHMGFMFGRFEMKRLLSLILIPLLLVSQALLAVPHTHAGTGVIEPDNHDAVPHVHFGHGHGRHSHDQGPLDSDKTNEEQERENCSHTHPTEHDSNAFYTSEIRLLKDSRQSILDSCSSFPPTSKVEPYVDCRNASSRSVSDATPVSCRHSELYLMLLSIRC